MTKYLKQPTNLSKPDGDYLLYKVENDIVYWYNPEEGWIKWIKYFKPLAKYLGLVPATDEEVILTIF